MEQALRLGVSLQAAKAAGWLAYHCAVGVWGLARGACPNTCRGPCVPSRALILHDLGVLSHPRTVV